MARQCARIIMYLSIFRELDLRIHVMLYFQSVEWCKIAKHVGNRIFLLILQLLYVSA